MSEYVTLSTRKSEITEILVVSGRPTRERRRFTRAPIKRRNGSRERCLERIPKRVARRNNTSR